MSDEKGISVVIATKGRVALLEILLNSLDKAIAKFPHSAEVILVDDSTGDDGKDIASLAEQHGFILLNYGPSVPAKRNYGARHGKFDVVLFLDSDCVATEDLLIEHYQCYRDPHVGSVAGLLEFVGPNSWFWSVVAQSPFVLFFGLPRYTSDVPWTPTANCSVRRDLFECVGGFDESFPPKPGGEDVDLGLRITAGKQIMKSSPKALVHHQKETWARPKAMFKRVWYYGSADYYLTVKHKQLVFPSYPRRVTLLALIALCSLMSTFLIKWYAVGVFLLTVFADLVISALVINHQSGHKLSLIQQLLMQALLIVNEAGYAWRCLRQSKPSYIGKQLIYMDGQAIGVTEKGSILAVIHAVSLLVLLFSIVLIYSFLV